LRIGSFENVCGFCVIEFGGNLEEKRVLGPGAACGENDHGALIAGKGNGGKSIDGVLQSAQLASQRYIVKAFG
jgi:hypothetical protein